jgi:hypothetical protein
MSILRPAVLSLAFAVLTACHFPDMHDRFGVVPLRMAGGEELYFRREAWGLGHNVLLLSASRDHCRHPDTQTDYVFAGATDKIYYRLAGPDTLDLFVTSAAPEPVRFPSRVRVIQHELTPREYFDLQEHYRDRGTLLMNVAIDPDLRCK